MIRVRFATLEDQPALIEFLRQHWSEQHVFVGAPEVFEWQHLQSDDRVNVMLAESTDERGAQSVVGFLGFIPMGRFDETLGDTDLTLAIWKVRDGAPPGLGLRLLKQLRADLQPRMIAAIGISDIVGPIYKVLRYDLGALDHTAIFHPQRADSLRLADNVPSRGFDALGPGDPDTVRFTRLDVDEDSSVREIVDQLGSEHPPRKSWTYVERRFLRHPFYDYEVSMVNSDGRDVAVVVWRQVEALGTSVLRIVDVIGGLEWLSDARRALVDEVVAADAEYIDLMQWGVPTNVVDAGGFIGPRTCEGMVIPNYFSPFERRNVDIALSCLVTDDQSKPPVLFRADSDQDRPNSAVDIAG